MKRSLDRGFVIMAALLALALMRPAAANERWIVVAPYVAEIVVALGGADRIVGLGGGGEHLEALAKVPRLPGFRQTSAEPILALQPTRILITDDRVAPPVIEQLKAAGVRIEQLDTEQSVAGAERRIRQVAQLLGKPSEGEALAARFRREMAELAQEVARARHKPRALFILAGGRRPIIVGGRGTSVAQVLELAGAVNVAAEIEGFKPMSQEAMVKAAPEVILTNRDGLTPTGDGTPIALKSPGAEATPAARHGRLIHIPDRYLGGIGLHTPEGVRLLLREIAKAMAK
ncbi:MAG: ABC transporter substrate-binding protein [Casimicrobiaceae bacterium]|nr:ABC transporter substrate-binding protein [Casimicrobiaceae bacterium]MCX8098567.1 ABC transporter substrate-binding protein [Casimicrobiaceae bacterium]MDW8312415.1 ABC transporter substrate-binding protein [Burkholderiales bacterium]